MHELLLFLHSWIRWIFFLLIIALWIRSLIKFRSSSVWDGTHSRLLSWATIVVTIQLFLGLILYVTSSIVGQGFANFSLAMKTSSIRFWIIEHPLLMVIVVGLTHFLSARVKKIPDDKRKYRLTLIISGIIFILLLAGNPFPWSPAVRPLFRGF